MQTSNQDVFTLDRAASRLCEGSVTGAGQGEWLALPIHSLAQLYFLSSQMLEIGETDAVWWHRRSCCIVDASRWGALLGYRVWRRHQPSVNVMPLLFILRTLSIQPMSYVAVFVDLV
jgi:hypothetical protein